MYIPSEILFSQTHRYLQGLTWAELFISSHKHVHTGKSTQTHVHVHIHTHFRSDKLSEYINTQVNDGISGADVQTTHTNKPAQKGNIIHTQPPEMGHTRTHTKYTVTYSKQTANRPIGNIGIKGILLH